MIVSTNKKLVAVSFDTTTYQDLLFYVSEHDDYGLERVDPFEFLSKPPETDRSYVNLVCTDVELRTKISNYFDTQQVFRFSMIHEQAHYRHASIGPGCVVYPLVSLYPNVTLEKDVIVHSLSVIAHNAKIGTGVLISGGSTLAGSAVIGDFTQIGFDVSIYEKTHIVDNTKIGAASVVRKNVAEPGVYSSQLKNPLIKIK